MPFANYAWGAQPSGASRYGEVSQQPANAFTYALPPLKGVGSVDYAGGYASWGEQAYIHDAHAQRYGAGSQYQSGGYYGGYQEEQYGGMEKVVKREVVEEQPAEKVTGGVSAELDYEVEDMAEFVALMTVAVTQHPAQASPAFKKFASQVLAATRLPSATILLSLTYLSARMALPSADEFLPASSRDLYRLLTVSLMLGNKFLDDNTFTNRSWADVSGLPIEDVNKLEKDWLKAIEWNLHLDRAGEKGWDAWKAAWVSWSEDRLIACERAERQRKMEQYAAQSPPALSPYQAPSPWFDDSASTAPSTPLSHRSQGWPSAQMQQQHATQWSAYQQPFQLSYQPLPPPSHFYSQYGYGNQGSFYENPFGWNNGMRAAVGA